MPTAVADVGSMLPAAAWHCLDWCSGEAQLQPIVSQTWNVALCDGRRLSRLQRSGLEGNGGLEVQVWDQFGQGGRLPDACLGEWVAVASSISWKSPWNHSSTAYIAPCSCFVIEPPGTQTTTTTANDPRILYWEIPLFIQSLGGCDMGPGKIDKLRENR